MRVLLGTNVVSELARSRPSANVLAWIEAVADESLHLSVLSIGEIRKGIERLPDGNRRAELARWLESELPRWFGPRLLPVDLLVVDRWGRLLAQSPRTLPAIDSLLAATALAHGLVLVTRNTRDFDIPGLEVVDPWRAR